MNGPLLNAGSDATGNAALSHRREVRRLERSTLLSAIRPLIVDLGSTLVFYAIFALTGDARVAAVIAMALAAGQLLLAWARRHPVPILQWASAMVVFAVGTFTLLTNDPRIALVKTTLVYGIIGTSMLRAGWMQRYIPAIAAGHLPTTILRFFERAWALLLLGTGVLNITLLVATDAHRAALFMVLWSVTSKLALFAIQYVRCRAVARPAIKAEMERSP